MTATCHTFSHDRYCALVRDEVARLVAVSDGVDGSTPVPTCPDWTLAALLEHIGTVHRWAANQVAVLTPDRIPSSTMDIAVPGDIKAFPEWLAEGGERLLEILTAADPDAEMWAWGSDKHARFWPRRMLHETTVHRADAEIALGREPAIDATIADDGVDEFLDNLPHAAYFAPQVEQLRGEGDTLRLHASDTGTSWRITLEPDSFGWDHSDGEASASVEGPAGGMVLFAYGRIKPGSGGITARGDQKILKHWIANSSI